MSQQNNVGVHVFPFLRNQRLAPAAAPGQSLDMLAAPIRLAEVRERLSRRQAVSIEDSVESQAAVAVLLAEFRGDTHALLIQRAEREGDPWSGHMAFPGGRREPHETDLLLTAARETHEEVGIDILAHAEPIGRLDDIRAQSDRPMDLLIRPYVYATSTEVDPRPNADEVQTTVWVPLSTLRTPAAAARHRYPAAGTGASFPAFQYRGFVIWGLTYRMLTGLLETISRAA